MVIGVAFRLASAVARGVERSMWRGAVDDESNSMPRVRSRKAAGTMWAGYNCDLDHGAASSSGPKSIPKGLGERRAAHPGHGGVVMDSAQTTCGVPTT